jgi:hypothetical protein
MPTQVRMINSNFLICTSLPLRTTSTFHGLG